MNIRLLKIIPLISLLFLVLNGCASNTLSKKGKGFKHNTPLIKDDIRKSGRIEIEKTVEMGPKPVEGDTKALQIRKYISAQQKRYY